eukprot:c29979_g1_i1 orf=269-547(+)
MAKKVNLVLSGSTSHTKLNLADFCNTRWYMCFGSKNVFVRQCRSGRGRRIHHNCLFLVKSGSNMQVVISLMAQGRVHKNDRKKPMATTCLKG